MSECALSLFPDGSTRSVDVNHVARNGAEPWDARAKGVRSTSITGVRDAGKKITRHDQNANGTIAPNRSVSRFGIQMIDGVDSP